jgi:hypothetical protein
MRAITSIPNARNKTHYFLAGEACVDRAWSSKVNDEDDEMIDVAVVLKPPDFDVIASLFPTHHIDSAGKMSRKQPASACTQELVTSVRPPTTLCSGTASKMRFKRCSPATNRDFSKLSINIILTTTIDIDDDFSSAHPGSTSPQQLPSSSQSTSVSTTNNTTQGENEKK